jgi:hypothetical protein
MLLDNRIIWDDNGTLKDLSVGLNNYHSGTETITFKTATDKIYIGSTLPFNHRYFWMSTANTNAATVAIRIWDGDEWKSCIDIIDQTIATSASLGASGHISFMMNKDDGWLREDTNQDGSTVTGLTDVNIYDLYWSEWSWNADWSSTVIKFIGNKFAEDEDLTSLGYGDLDNTNMRKAFFKGTDPGTWDEVHFEVAEFIIKDLKQKKVIFDKNQIIRWELLKPAAVHKLAEMVYRGFGDAFEDNRKRAATDYYKAINLDIFKVDKNANTRVDGHESVSGQGELTR